MRRSFCTRASLLPPLSSWRYTGARARKSVMAITWRSSGIGVPYEKVKLTRMRNGPRRCCAPLIASGC